MKLAADADREQSLNAVWYALCAAMRHSYYGTGYANPCRSCVISERQHFT